VCVAFGRALGVARSGADLRGRSSSPPIRVTSLTLDIEPLAGGTRVPHPPTAIAITDAPAGALLTGLMVTLGPASDCGIAITDAAPGAIHRLRVASQIDRQ
jgi:hypothetical protein